jgi:hypothetical protein
MTGQRGKNSHKRRRQDSDQDVSTPIPGAALQPRGRHESSSVPHAVLDPQFNHVPTSNTVLSPFGGRPDPAEISSISDWITQLTHDDLQGLLADAAARHQDVFTALETKSREADLARRGSRLRIEKHLMDSFYPDLPFRETSRSASSRTPATEQAVVLEETPDNYDNEDEEDEEEQDDPELRGYPAELQHILLSKWEYLSPPDRLEKVGTASEEIVKIIDKIVNAARYTRSYETKAMALLASFRIAEVLTESCTMFVNHVRAEILRCGYHEKVTDMSRCLITREVISLIQDELFMEYLSGIFSDSSNSQSGNMMVFQIKSIILDLKSRARQALASRNTKLQRLYCTGAESSIGVIINCI